MPESIVPLIGGMCAVQKRQNYRARASTRVRACVFVLREETFPVDSLHFHIFILNNKRAMRRREEKKKHMPWHTIITLPHPILFTQNTRARENCTTRHNIKMHSFRSLLLSRPLAGTKQKLLLYFSIL